MTVTALQPGPTDTDFFHRAGMDDTKVGSEGKKESDPADVARQGIDALFDGKDHVYAASLKTKIEGKLANAIPGEMKGRHAREDGAAARTRNNRPPRTQEKTMADAIKESTETRTSRSASALRAWC